MTYIGVTICIKSMFSVLTWRQSRATVFTDSGNRREFLCREVSTLQPVQKMSTCFGDVTLTYKLLPWECKLQVEENGLVPCNPEMICQWHLETKLRPDQDGHGQRYFEKEIYFCKPQTALLPWPQLNIRRCICWIEARCAGVLGSERKFLYALYVSYYFECTTDYFWLPCGKSPCSPKLWIFSLKDISTQLKYCHSKWQILWTT